MDSEAGEVKHRKLEAATKSMMNVETGKIENRTVMKAGLRNEDLENRQGKMSDPLVIFDSGYIFVQKCKVMRPECKMTHPHNTMVPGKGPEDRKMMEHRLDGSDCKMNANAHKTSKHWGWTKLTEIGIWQIEQYEQVTQIKYILKSGLARCISQGKLEMGLTWHIRRQATSLSCKGAWMTGKYVDRKEKAGAVSRFRGFRAVADEPICRFGRFSGGGEASHAISTWRVPATLLGGFFRCRPTGNRRDFRRDRLE